MSRLSVIGQRLLHLIPVLIGISVISFLLVKLSPGDPIRMLLGDRATEEAVSMVRERYGLDRPLLEQYLVYIGNLLQGDLGRSIRYRLPVGELILDFLPRTLFLVLYVMCLSVPATVLLAIAAARNQGGWIDQSIRVLSVCGMTIPVFWLAVMLSRFFGVELGWFPVSGYGETFIEHLHHLFLPAVSTAVWLVPLLVRNLRAAILEQMEADYVTASRSKGLPEGYIFRRHIFLNSVLPTLHLLGVMVAFLIGSSVVVEIVYAVPGLGALMISSVIGRDYYVVQGLTLVYALGTVLVTLTVDVISTLVDPRVKL
ncbi:ABC transporter permease [Rhodospirillaceae bacterium SYSU D60014]|uniref:ABC transporter permease n=1 Tax=Virgifigura deserti TaxID=2268457 RepID=UPI000E65FE07